MKGLRQATIKGKKIKANVIKIYTLAFHVIKTVSLYKIALKFISKTYVKIHGIQSKCNGFEILFKDIIKVISKVGIYI